MGQIVYGSPPTKEQFSANPEYYWSELRNDQKTQRLRNAVQVSTLLLGFIGVLFFVFMVVIKC